MDKQHHTVTFTTPDAAEEFTSSLHEHGVDSDAQVVSDRVVTFTSWATTDVVHALVFKFDVHAVVESVPLVKVASPVKAAPLAVNYKASFPSIHAAHTFYGALVKSGLASGVRESIRNVWFSTAADVTINAVDFGGTVVRLPHVEPIGWSGMWEGLTYASRVVVVVGVTTFVLACAGIGGILIADYEPTPSTRSSTYTPGELQTDIGSPAACSGIETKLSEMTALEKRAWLALDC